MAIREIPQDEWVTFFNDFNKEHRDKIVSIMATNDEGYVIDSAERIPFAGIEVNPRDVENTIVQIAAGEISSTTLVTHFIDKVERLVLDETENGDPQKLFVYSALGRSCEIRFLKLEE
ncbi:MAG TPA: DUF5335 family protein [Ignavibacteriales bacterium]|nr:DUF5335 family protein [Ignavibacteriales bacterium]